MLKLKLYIVISFFPVITFSQLITHDRLLSFEDNASLSILSSKSSNLSLSNAHYKDGARSLEWNFRPHGELSIKKDLHFEIKDSTGVDTYLSTFFVWVYNEKAINDFIQFQFLKDGKVYSSFPFKIDFTGWRAAWVSYERDMEGTPIEGMNEIRIIAPNESSRLFFDKLITAAKTDHRHHSADLQVPFVNKNTTNHWLVVLQMSQIKPDLSLDSIFADTQKESIRKIEERYFNHFDLASTLTERAFWDINNDFEKYNISVSKTGVSGTPIFFAREAEAFERLIPDWSRSMYIEEGVEVRRYFDLMYRVASAYHTASEADKKEKLEEIFVKMYRHITDQGFVYGSCLGNITHYGYSFRNLYTSYFLMKDVLAKAGKLSEAAKTLQWYAMANEVFLQPKMQGMDMDAFNTYSNGRLASILIMDNSPEKVRYLNGFSRWIDNGCLPAPGLAGAFKVDGGAFHHCNNYPAYAIGGLSGATDMIYLLSGTDFAVSELAHQTVKDVLLTMRFYCHTTYFPLSMSGRHPDGKGQLIPMHFAQLAMAGLPDGSNDIDAGLAAEFLRLISFSADENLPEYSPIKASRKELKAVNFFRNMGIQATNDSFGNKALGYGCVSVQRGNGWTAVARGHSRYLWAAEHYLGANLYGRYLAHGSLQISSTDKINLNASNHPEWRQEGFDWGRIPGTTAIHLPVEQLKANVLNVDVHSGFEEMLLSDEAFAGGLSQQDKSGVFAMKLHEHDKYNGSHRARKSYHFLENIIVCIGTDIENLNADYPTETTIFQLPVNEAQKAHWNDYKRHQNYWIDHLNTGYFVPAKEQKKIVFEKNFPQLSRMQNTGEPTEGDWVNLVVSHGKAPANESYEYVVIPQTTNEIMDAFSKKPSYKIIRKDKNAHIITNTAAKLTSYAFFEPMKKLKDDFILSVDTSCLIMVKEDKDNFTLTVCNPDLGLYSGPADEIYNEKGKRVERSIYSRPWKFNESKEMPVTVTLKGQWIIEEAPWCEVISQNKKETVLKFYCKDGASYDLEVRRM